MFVLYCILLLAVIYCVISFICALITIRRGVQRTSNTEYFSENGTSARHAMRERIEKEASEIYTMPHEDHYLVSYDGLRLHASLYRAAEAKGIAICVHGFHSRAEKDFSSLFHFYQDKHQFHVLLIDQRSHMMSEGRYACYGAAEKYDLRDWIGYCSSLFGKEFPVWLHGESMGAATCMMTADMILPGNVRGIIDDSGYSTAIRQMRYLFRKYFHIPSFPGVFFLRAFFSLFLRISLRDADAQKSLRNTEIPCLFIHGAADDVVPCEMCMDAYHACASEKMLWIVPNGGHCAAYWQAEEEYIRRLECFLKKTIPS